MIFKHCRSYCQLMEFATKPKTNWTLSNYCLRRSLFLATSRKINLLLKFWRILVSSVVCEKYFYYSNIYFISVLSQYQNRVSFLRLTFSNLYRLNYRSARIDIVYHDPLQWVVNCNYTKKFRFGSGVI